MTVSLVTGRGAHAGTHNEVMGVTSGIAGLFRMTDDAWRRHANPWSVWTRFAAIPLMILAIWSRVWLGWWCLLPVAVVMVWLWLNPRVFAPVDTPESWAAKGIYGEKLWLTARDRVPPDHLKVLRLLMPVGAVGAAVLVYGLVRLEIWPTVLGATLIVLAQLWRIDRLVVFYESTASVVSRDELG
jgi:hypothetical protein